MNVLQRSSRRTLSLFSSSLNEDVVKDALSKTTRLWLTTATVLSMFFKGCYDRNLIEVLTIHLLEEFQQLCLQIQAYI